MPAERTVHVVDDDAAVRRSFERLLKAAGFRVKCYDRAAAFLEVAAAMAGCILLDFRMPGMDGLELQARLIELDIALPVILVTGQGDVKSAVRALKAGAIDFIEKPCDEHVLLAAVEVALTKGDALGRSREAAEAAKRVSALSPRENEVLEALVAGQSSKLIAHELGISVRTVEVHRARMMDRLGVRHVGQAVRLAVIARFGRPNVS